MEEPEGVGIKAAVKEAVIRKRAIRQISEYQGDFPLHLETCMRILRAEAKKPLAEAEMVDVLALMEHLANRVRMPTEAARKKAKEMWRQLRGVVGEVKAATAEVERLEGEVMSLRPAFANRGYLERQMRELRTEHQQVLEEVDLLRQQCEEAQRVAERGERLVMETARILERYAVVPKSTDPETLAFAVECRTIGASLRSLQAMAERERAKLAGARRKWEEFRAVVHALLEAL